MNNIYLVANSGHQGYDTYDNHVVLAKSEHEACNIAKNRDSNGTYLTEDVSLVGISDLPESRIVLSSFNAG